MDLRLLIRNVPALVTVCLLTSLADARVRTNGRYEATAYSVKGETAAGDITKRRIVAADPDILPLGTVIRITQAGPYSGQYTVSDTGNKIQGRKVDIYMPSAAEATKFGKKPVMVRVVKLAKPVK